MAGRLREAHAHWGRRELTALGLESEREAGGGQAVWTGSQGRKRAGAAGQRPGEGADYRSWRRNTLLRLSLTMSSSSVSCSLAIRGMSSRTLCCMARHVRLSSCGGSRRDGHGPGGQERGHGRGLGSSLCATLDDRGFQTDSKLHRTAAGVPQTPSGSHLQCPMPILSTRETSHTRDRAAGLTWLCADLPLPATFARVKNQQCQWSVEHTATSLGDWDLFVTKT